MNDISVGAVGAAVVAGLVSILGLIIGKEQKVSEFRQAWINDLRVALISYLVNINAIADSIRIKSDFILLTPLYKALNEASHGITLRINSKEKPAKKLLQTMNEFELLAGQNATLTPDRIRAIEAEFIKYSKKLLKFEWKRVKRGENIYVWSKWIVGATTALMVVAFGYLWATRPPVPTVSTSASPTQASTQLPGQGGPRTRD